jgi:hypothetical protein
MGKPRPSGGGKELTSDDIDEKEQGRGLSNRDTGLHDLDPISISVLSACLFSVNKPNATGGGHEAHCRSSAECYRTPAKMMMRVLPHCVPA